MSVHPVDEPFQVLRGRRPAGVQRPPAGLTGLPHGLSPATPTTLAAVDINTFGRRDDETQLHVRQMMYACVENAFAMTGLPWRICRREDRGDGILIVTPPEVPAEAFMDPLAHHLHAGLRRHNRLASETARLRLRLAVHTGRIHRDENGVTGHALVHLYRLLDAPAVKKAAKVSGADLCLIVSDRLYQDAIRQGGLIDPAAYRSRRITYKDTRTRGWIWLSPTGASRARGKLWTHVTGWAADLRTGPGSA